MPKVPVKGTSKVKAKKTQPKGKGKGKEKPLEKKGPKRKVVYTEVSTTVWRGRNPFRSQDAREHLGWVEESEKVKFGADYLLKDADGKKVRCLNNVGNRIYQHSRTLTYMQDILRGRWQFNGHNRIIGRYGSILSGQHVLPALVLAAQTWEKSPESYPYWAKEPTIETSIIYGIGESNEIKDTIDTARESNLTDVVFRYPYFEHLSVQQRKGTARMVDYAIRLLWDRTGAKHDAYAPRRTHREALAFLDRHPKVLECVSHIREEDEGKKTIARFTNLGTAAGFLFMMGSSASNPVAYHEQETASESTLDWTNWDKACDFFVLLADGKSKESKSLSAAFRQHIDSDWGLSTREKWALLLTAWNCYIQEQNLTPKRLTLKYDVDEDGGRSLEEMPTAGGIDQGDGTKDEAAIAADDPSDLGITIAADEAKTSALVIGKKAGDDWDKNDTAWVYDTEKPNVPPYFARVVGPPYMVPNGRNILMQESLGPDSEKEWEVSVEHLHLECPITE